MLRFFRFFAANIIRMKQLVIIVAATLMLAACGTQTTKETTKEMNKLTFTTEQAALMSAIACNEAKAARGEHHAIERLPQNLLETPAFADGVKRHHVDQKLVAVLVALEFYDRNPLHTLIYYKESFLRLQM